MLKRFLALALLILTVIDIMIGSSKAVIKDHHIPHHLDDIPHTGVTKLRDRLRAKISLAGTLRTSGHLGAVIIRANGEVEHRDLG
jgi:hypothetical protein